jgi:hypothetical protein
VTVREGMEFLSVRECCGESGESCAGRLSLG